MALALLAALAVTVALTGLTFSVLAVFVSPIIALPLAFSIHLCAIVAAHFVLMQQREIPRLVLGLAIGLSTVAWLLARARAMLFFEDNTLLGTLAALVEPLAIWVCALWTARAHDLWACAEDHLRRSRDLLEASAARRNSSVWAKALREADDELREVRHIPADTNRAMRFREWRLAHLTAWRRLAVLHSLEDVVSQGPDEPEPIDQAAPVK